MGLRECVYFEPWSAPEQNMLELHGAKIGLVVCEDSWNDEQFFGRRAYAIDPVERVVAAGAEVVEVRGGDSVSSRGLCGKSARTQSDSQSPKSSRDSTLSAKSSEER